MRQKFCVRAAVMLLSACLASPAAAGYGFSLSGDGTEKRNLAYVREIVREKEVLQFEEIGLTIEIPDGYEISTGEDEDGFYYLYPMQKGIPYVMFGAYDYLTEENFFGAFNRLMEDVYEDLELVQEPAEKTIGSRTFHEFRYAYTVSGYPVEDTRLYTEVNGIVYMFGSKEVPSIGYTVGNLLYDAAAGIQVKGEKKGIGTGGDVLPSLEPEPETESTDTDDQQSGSGWLKRLTEAIGKTGNPSGTEETEPVTEEASGGGNTGPEIRTGEGSLLDAQAGTYDLPVSYSISAVNHPSAGLPMARCFAPSDYRVFSASRSIDAGIGTPMQVIIQAVSPQNEVSFTYYSEKTFQDNEMVYNGQHFIDEEGSYDASNLILNYRTRNASEYCDFLKEEFLQDGIGTELVEEKGPDETQRKLMEESGKELKKGLNEFYRQLGSDMEVTDCGFSYAVKLYSLTLKDASTPAGTSADEQVPYYLVVSSLVRFGESYSGFSYGDGGAPVEIYGIPINSGFSTDSWYRSWSPIVSYTALIPQEKFAELWPVFRAFACNTRVSDEFLLMRENLANLFQTAKIQAQETGTTPDYSEIAEECAKQFLSNETYTGADPWHDRVWGSDYYVLSDRNHIKVSPLYSHVCEDGKGGVFVTNGAQIPEGYRELTPVQAGR